MWDKETLGLGQGGGDSSDPTVVEKNGERFSICLLITGNVCNPKLKPHLEITFKCFLPNVCLVQRNDSLNMRVHATKIPSLMGRGTPNDRPCLTTNLWSGRNFLDLTSVGPQKFRVLGVGHPQFSSRRVRSSAKKKVRSLQGVGVGHPRGLGQGGRVV